MNSWMKKTGIGRAVAFRLPARAHPGPNSFPLREPLERGHMSRSPAMSRNAHARVAFFVIRPEVGWRVYWTMVSAGTLQLAQRKKSGESESPIKGSLARFTSNKRLEPPEPPSQPRPGA
jgi:hypothetical protein